MPFMGTRGIVFIQTKTQLYATNCSIFQDNVKFEKRKYCITSGKMY